MMTDTLPVVRRIPHTADEMANLSQWLVISCGWTPTEAERLAFELLHWQQHQGTQHPSRDGKETP